MNSKKLKLRRHIDVMQKRCIFPIAGALGVAGCARAPSINILGAFFPAWMVCAMTGIVLTFVLRTVLVAARLDEYVGPRGIIYPASAILFTLATWVLFFRN
jgi:hypothetical protein